MRYISLTYIPNYADKTDLQYSITVFLIRVIFGSLVHPSVWKTTFLMMSAWQYQKWYELCMSTSTDENVPTVPCYFIYTKFMIIRMQRKFCLTIFYTLWLCMTILHSITWQSWYYDYMYLHRYCTMKLYHFVLFILYKFVCYMMNKRFCIQTLLNQYFTKWVACTTYVLCLYYTCIEDFLILKNLLLLRIQTGICCYSLIELILRF
jgi:hypothetical protein